MAMEKAPDLFAEVNLFVKTPQDFEGHIKLMVPQSEAASHMLAVSLKLAEKGFVPSQRNGTGGAKPAPQRGNGRQVSQKNAAPSDVACLFCDGPTWDNRTTKRNPKQPDWKCRDKDNCGAAAWMREDGELFWKEGQ